MKVELKTGQVALLPAAGKSFDPTRIPKAVKDAGFTPGEVDVTAIGTLTTKKEWLLLEMSGLVQEFVLAGGAKADELKKQSNLLGRRLRVKGKLHPSHADRPPGLTVEQWRLVDQSE